MTKKDTQLNKPFLLRPVGKNYLWGGNRLKEEYGKNIDIMPLAETWECSTHPDGLSVVGSGEDEGKTLKTVLQSHPEYLGRNASKDGELPVLIKFIDAKNDLSVQVHPSDEYAREKEGGSMGKTEMWYVVDADKNSSLVYGVKGDIKKETLMQGIKEHNLPRLLQYYQVKKNDVFFIEAGIIHAIGSGLLIAEIQECSNLTYRLYDYGRKQEDGSERPLHIEKALDVARLTPCDSTRQRMRVLNYSPGMASELICHCKYFDVYRQLVNSNEGIVILQTDSITYRIMLFLDGEGIIKYDEEKMIFHKGDCVFVPSNSYEIKLEGKGELLIVRGC